MNSLAPIIEDTLAHGARPIVPPRMSAVGQAAYALLKALEDASKATWGDYEEICRAVRELNELVDSGRADAINEQIAFDHIRIWLEAKQNELEIYWHEVERYEDHDVDWRDE